MKAYADAGLVQLASASGHRAETLTSLIQCSNFRRTHNFLLSNFEALYRVFVSWYACKRAESDSDYLGDIKSLLVSLITKLTEVSTDEELQDFRGTVHERFSTQLNLSGAFEDFTHFMEDIGKRQDTIRFWHQFVMKDCFAYLCLFIGIRYRNWMLRTCGIKLMAAVFSAFDRPIYQQLIPQHLLDIQRLPKPVLAHLQKGGFSVRLSPSEWHSVALDECHEMKVNKDAKLAIVRPSESKIVHLSNYLPFRSACLRVPS